MDRIIGKTKDDRRVTFFNIDKKRCLFGVFPVWLDFSKNDDAPEITGFWSDIAIFIDDNLASFCHFISFGLWDREMFAFFPYKENDCKYWFQAIWKSYLNSSKYI